MITSSCYEAGKFIKFIYQILLVKYYRIILIIKKFFFNYVKF